MSPFPRPSTIRPMFPLMLTLLGLSAGPLAAQTATCDPSEVTHQAEQRLQAGLDELVAQNPATPGVLVHVEAPGLCLSWSGASGISEIASETRLRPNQTFRIASNTKTYTAATILRLVEQGKLGLKQSLDEVLPKAYLEMLRSGGYPTKTMTIEHLLTHTSGLFDHAATNEYMRDIFGNPHRQWKREDQIRYSAQYGTPHGAPGETFSYADTGYVILGGLIEKETGMTMAEAFRELLGFGRLGLDATWTESFEPQPKGAGARVHQYLGTSDTYDWNPSLDLYGGGGVVTSARDLAMFVRFLMQGKVFDKPETLETMLGTEIAPNQGGYRIGIERIMVSGKAGWGHTGFWNTFAYHFPDDDVTVAGSVNQQEGPAGRRLAASLAALVQSLQTRR